jgi:hypothetical protein
MPRFGLLAAVGGVPRGEFQRKTSAHERLRTTEPEYVDTRGDVERGRIM